MNETVRWDSGAQPAVERRGESANLADILERVLDKGIVIAGDIQVNLLDIELLTIKVRLVVASVDRAKEMGIDWWERDPTLSAGRQDLEDENARLRRRLEALEAGGGRDELPAGAGDGVSGREDPATGSRREEEAAPTGLRRENARTGSRREDAPAGSRDGTPARETVPASSRTGSSRRKDAATSRDGGGRRSDSKAAKDTKDTKEAPARSRDSGTRRPRKG
ncbi:gas vesicle protein [Pseudonocardia sp. C8]|uniref:gas vesicle protein GvpJ n=1 Tax=Pseudonocardia sp. C8 TaxID=2762759 RepID=UPI00164308DD|nr:gas vesicle protein [Pseudonocardia sp. C8]